MVMRPLRRWAVQLSLVLLLFVVKFARMSSTSMEATLSQTQSIADGEVLVSAGGKFALGFFRPGNSTRRYLGIWYYKVSEQTVVWVANREAPLNDTSGVVTFDGAGNLIIAGNQTDKGHGNRTIWSTNVFSPAGHVAAPKGTVKAELLDTGNLIIVRQRTGERVWQSFDNPSDTMLPFMKLGLDRRTGMNRMLTSWRAKDDPGTGSCTYRIDPKGTPQLFVFKGSRRWWRGGPWNGQRWSGVPEMNDNFIFNISYVDDADELSISYGLKNASIFSRMTIAESGTVQRLTWHRSERRWTEFWSAPKDSCDSYAQCGAFGYCDPDRNPGEFECQCLPGFRPRAAQDWYLRDGSEGCVRGRGPGSACGRGEGFVRLERAKVPDTSVARADGALSGEACAEACARNCSCTAYASADMSGGGGGRGCLAWYGDLVDIEVYSGVGQDLFVRVDAVALADASKRRKGLHRGKRTLVVVLVAAASMVLLMVVLFQCCFYSERLQLMRGNARWRSHQTSLLGLTSPNINSVEGNERVGGDGEINLPFFGLREIKAATNNFSNKLGEGGFGEVYKGNIWNGQEIAVKRLSKHSGQGAEEFKNEVLLIAKLQHRNLVKILGCCIDGEENMLIYEYMPNKSLDSFLFDQAKKASLDWKKRFEIIVGIARGILYLHQDSRLRIVHRDLKASNILLDAEMNPKISDFGMARIFGGNQTQANTNRVVGTFGYMSPEYAMDGLFSMKSDVFSFGVLLLEIISGKKNLSVYDEDPFSNLVRYIWELWKEGRALDMVDEAMGESWEEIEVVRCVQVGLLCVQGSATDRPTMAAVVLMLSNDTGLPLPNQPTFAVRRGGRDTVGSNNSQSASGSKNEITMTTIYPR